jgi:carboxypeptidase Taq
MSGDAWSDLKGRVTEIEALQQVLALLSWDQQTMMPSGGAAGRGRHVSTLSALAHDKLVDSAVGDWLSELEARDPAELTDLQAASMRKIRRLHDRARCVPTALVRAMAEASSEGVGAWVAAKQAADFAPFAPALTRIVELVRETAASHGTAGHPYDHLLEEYDPGATVADLEPMFARLGGELATFVQEASQRADPAPLHLDLDEPGILAVGQRLVTALGFRPEDGRLDRSEHPFTVGIGPHDVRLTTHGYADDLLGSLTGTIHECGHGLYEQGLNDDWVGTGVATAAGVGLHESQSRFWENVIGRSRPFFGWLVGLLSEQWPDVSFDPDQLYAVANRVHPSFIRVKADEATYNLHVIVRFRLELALMTGDLQVADLPDAWDHLYEQLLGVRPPDPAQGVLQDVHWAHGYFGYFPSYTVGNLYAASMKQAMQADLPDMWDQVGAGDFGAVLGWLREKVHARGHLVDAPQVFRDAVGDRDPVADLMAHLRERHGTLAGL